jgi:predicted nucleic acid-binding protein
VPALCDVEVAAGLRRGMLGGAVAGERVVQAMEDYVDLPVTRHGHQRLLGRILGLRENFSAYDATYVALTEQLGGELLTADERLAGAASVHAHLAIASL